MDGAKALGFEKGQTILLNIQAIMERIKSFLKESHPSKWLFYGDSITHGAKHTLGHRDFSELFRERLVWEMQRHGDLVLNAAYSGFTCAELLGEFDWRAKSFAPNVAFIMIGTNDCTRFSTEEFRANLIELLGELAEIDALPVLMTPIPVLRELNEQRKSLPLFAQVIREVAAAKDVPLIDHFQLWEQCPGKFYLYSDELHPNEHGHLKIALDIFKALDIYDSEKSWVCHMFAPEAL